MAHAVVELADFFFVETPLSYRNSDLLGPGFRDNPSGALAAIEAVRGALAEVEPWSAAAVEAALRALAERLELKAGHLFTPMRVAVTGRTAAPPLVETVAVLERSKSLLRLDQAAERLARPDD